MAQGCTTDVALEAFEKAGCDVDSLETLARWRRYAFGSDDLVRVVRGKLIDALDGKKVWRKRDRASPGAIDAVPPESLPSGRVDSAAQAIRVRALYVGDKKSIGWIAETENLDEADVREILEREGVTLTKSKKKGKAKADPAEQDLSEALARIERIRAMYESQGRPFPQSIAEAIKKAAS